MRWTVGQAVLSAAWIWLRNVRLPYRSPGFWLIIAGFAAYVGLGVQAFDKPGLYMDAVNPDYLVVRMANPSSPTEEWILPGDLLFGRFPVLAGPYSGPYATYFTLPFYLLFGGSLTSLRLAHLTFGLVILAAACLLFRQASRSTTIAAAFTLLLGTDPAFIFPFRTQASTTTLPEFPMLLAVFVLCRYRSMRAYATAGLALGLAAWGYFIFSFLVPGIALYILTDREATDRGKKLLAFGGGFALGVVPYFIGYGLIILTSGSAAGSALIGGLPNQLHANTGDPYLVRAIAIFHETWSVLTAEWDWQTFFAVATHNDYGQTIKVWALLLVALAAIPFVRRTSDIGKAFALIALCDLSYVLVATVFGQRLGAHDLTATLPLTYALAAASCAILWTRIQGPALLQNVVAWIALVGFVAANVSATSAIATTLARNGGAALFSSIISDYPALENARKDRTPHIFWEWGSMLPFIYLTGGEIPAYSRNALPTVLCQYGKAKIVLIGDDATHPGLAVGNIGVQIDGIQALNDFHSGFPYTVVSVRSKGAQCEAPAPTIVPGTGFPPGVMSAGTSTVTGLYPDIPSACCFVAARASFDVDVPPAARTLRFDVYIPNYPMLPKTQRLTVKVNGQTTESQSLPAGKVTAIDVPLRQGNDRTGVARVELIPSNSFIPKDVGLNADTRRLSVILLKVSSAL